MAARKLTSLEIFINVLFWAAMTFSGVGLLIYGGFQLFLKLTGKPFHFFKVGSKKKKPIEEKPAQESLTEESSTEVMLSIEEDKNKKSHQTVKPKKTNQPSSLTFDEDYVHQELKVAIQDYRRSYHIFNDYIRGITGKSEPWLKIFYTKIMFGLNDLMNDTNPKAYNKLLVDHGNFIMRILQLMFGDMIWHFDPCTPPKNITIEKGPDSVIDFYNKLPRLSLYTEYPNDLLQKIIDLSPNPTNKNANLVINLEPVELAGNTYYVYLNSFIRETNDPGFKKLAFEKMTDQLAEYLAQKYKVELKYNEKKDQYYIPPEQRWQLGKYANLSALNPPFSALAAKRKADRAKAEQEKIESQDLGVKDSAKEQQSDHNSDSHRLPISFSLNIRL